MDSLVTRCRALLLQRSRIRSILRRRFRFHREGPPKCLTGDRSSRYEVLGISSNATDKTDEHFWPTFNPACGIH
jgi:hypothetical protein